MISQPFGNEWLNYNQKYLEIKITDTGIYRINYTVLLQGLSGIGESISTIDPREIRIFAIGEEQYIYIEGETDGSFDSTDFIEFFAVKNDGWLDSLIYETPSAQSNPYYSLFNDTATYFLTISDSNGKRMSVSTDTNFPPSAFPYFFKETIVSFPNKYYQGEYDSQGAYLPLYRDGEGWFSQEINSSGNPNFSYTFNNLFPHTATPLLNANLKIVYSGVNANSHNIQISYNSTSINDNFNGFLLRKQDAVIPSNSLLNTLTFAYKSLSPPNSSDRTAVSHIYLKYPRDFNFSGISEMLMLLPADAGKTYLKLNNFSTSFNFVYDLTSHQRDTLVQSQQTLISPANSERKVFATNQIQNISSLIPATANNGKFTDFSLAPDSTFVIIAHKILWNEANQYAAERNNSLLADIDELYAQFAYGINKHPLAIRNFCRFLLNKSPQHLFIIGKGIADDVFSTRNNLTAYEKNLIPTYSYPASDVAFTAGLNDLNRTIPAIPTGRLAAKNSAEVLDYLNKVKQFENNHIENEVTQSDIPNRIRLKHAIHFCGGNEGSQNESFCNYVRYYEDLFESDSYGGFVTTISKNTTGIINLSDSIKNQINSGISLLTFFGHSSGSISEINIGFADEYENQGKYPMIIANGCFSGDIFTAESESTSEDFVLEKQKGAIAYIAHTGLGYPSQLDNYTSNLYGQFSKQSYHESIGKCIQQGISGMWQTNDTNFIGTATMLGMTLHGDPSLKINSHEKPDYAIAQPYVYFTPQEVTTADDSFEINIVIFNLGKAITDSLSILVRRTFPNGNSESYNKIIPPVFYKDTFTLKLPVDDSATGGAGLNQFFIMVDDFESIEEIAELNNIIGGNNSVELNIKSGELIPVYPYNFAVVPNRKIALAASTSEFFVSEKQYIFQIDTTDLYNSSSFRQFTITSSGGVVKWNIDTNYFKLFPDSTVFFWRTSPNTSNDYKWREHSFQIISGKEGWGQKHFFQLKNDNFSGIQYDRNSRQLKFDSSSATIKCDVWGYPGGANWYNELLQTGYFINYSLQDNAICNGVPVMLVAVIDECTLEPWETAFVKCPGFGAPCDTLNPTHDFGNGNNMLENNSNNCGITNRPYPAKLFSFMISDPEQMDSLRTMIDHKIPDGNYVLAYTGINARFKNTSIWTDELFAAFEKHGATKISNVPDSFPYIFFAKIGDVSTAQEEISPDSAHRLISLAASMNGCIGKGTISTSAIGPAEKWNSLHWKFSAESSDSINMNVLNETGNAIKNYQEYYGNIIPLDMNSKTVKLSANLKDTIANSCPQLNYWYVLFDEIPEAALDNPFNFYAGNLQQGDNMKFNVAIENVSHSDMDSLRIKYWIVSGDAISSVIYKKKKPLFVGEIMYDTISFSTKNINGNCRFWIEVNPKDSLWQTEQFHFNNIASMAFEVKGDNINPLLDVTFDGVRILNGDIVSPTPEIIVQLKDENKFLAMDDTSNFKIFLIDPEQTTERIYFTKNSAEQMRFAKATLPENKCKIEWNAKFSKDGIYKLSVQGSDASGNNAGDLDYSIIFEVISKSTITEVLNYPNPFSSSTRFVFTLTGSEIPDYFKIQILTISGKVVREITRGELGNIHIGRNITEYAWNGTDEFGDPLANGVYLYRVIAKINGEEIEHRQTNADSFFKKGFGKMYLMR